MAHGVSEARVQNYARLAGVLFLLTMVAGFFGEVYVPSHLIVPDNGAATASNLVTSRQLFNAGFACYLIEAVCDVLLSWILYVLLRPVHRELALLAAFIGLVSTTLVAVAFVMSPAYASDLFLLPMFVATLSITCWLLVKGIDIKGWRAME